MAVDLKNHPFANPAYEEIKALRELAIRYNHQNPSFRPVHVPKLPNKYIPHIGAKQRAKTANHREGAMHYPSKDR